MAFKKRKDMNTAEKLVEMTDIVKTFGDGIWGDKYNAWLDKSNTKASGFVGKFLRVSFWISVILTLLALFLMVSEVGLSGHRVITKSKEIFAVFFLIPAIFTTAIQLLRHKYYGLFKLLWLFPIVLWVFIFAVFGFGILSEINPELYNKIWDLI